jgi:hypothetical protein
LTVGAFLEVARVRNADPLQIEGARMGSKKLIAGKVSLGIRCLAAAVWAEQFRRTISLCNFCALICRMPFNNIQIAVL